MTVKETLRHIILRDFEDNDTHIYIELIIYNHILSHPFISCHILSYLFISYHI